MSTVLHQYVNNIIKNIDGNAEEKADIHEEFLIHLQLSSNQYLEAGYEKQEADKIAIDNFGHSDDIGNHLQEAMFPFRKKLFLILAIASLIYSFIAYASALFVEGDAHFIWLIISVLSSSILLTFALQLYPSLDRKVCLNSALIVHTFIFLYGSFLGSTNLYVFSTFLTIVAYSIGIFSIVLIYRTTIYDYPYKQPKQVKYLNMLHGFNITIGIIATGTSLFFLWAILLFAETFNIKIFITFIPLIIWIIAYIIQVKLVSYNKKKSAVVVGVLVLLFYLIIVFLLFMPLGGNL